MSLKDSHPRSVPEDTARIAKAVFRKGHRYLLLRDTFGDFFDSDDFRTLFHAEGRPAVDPAQLALITLVQFAENLSDERAADAVRARIDLKYLLALPLDHPGFDASELNRVPHPVDRRSRRIPVVRAAPRTIPRAAVAARSRSAAYGLDSRAGRRPIPEPGQSRG